MQQLKELSMNTKKNLNLARKMTAFVSIVTAGAFVGLPAMAQMGSFGSSDRAQNSGGSQYPADCVPMSSTTQSNSMTRQTLQNSNQNFQNQADPRSNIDQGAYTSGTNGSIINSGTGGGAGGVGGEYPNSSTMTSSSTSSSNSLDEQNRYYNQSGNRARVTNSFEMGTNTSEMGTSANSVTDPTNMSDRTQAGTYGSQQNISNRDMTNDNYRSDAGYSPNGYQQGGVMGYEHSTTIGGNVLAFGGATTGGQARQIVEASRRFEDQARSYTPNSANSTSSSDSGYRSSSYTSSNQMNSSSYNATSSTGSPINNNSNNDSYRNSNQVYNSNPGADYNNTSQTSNSSSMSSSDRMAGTSGTCPPGMVRRSQSNSSGVQQQQIYQNPSLQQNDSNAPDFRSDRPSSGADNTLPTQTTPGVRNDVDPNTQAIPGQGGSGQLRQNDTSQ